MSGPSLRPSVVGPYSLAASTRLFGAFGPALGAGVEPDGVVRLALRDEGSELPVLLRLRQDDAVVSADVVAGDPSERLGDQLARILALDVDGRPVLGIRRADPVVDARWSTAEGFRPVQFHRPFEAAVWAILTQRTSPAVARSIWARWAEHLGDRVGGVSAVFPGPRAVRDAASLPGVPLVKAERLRAIADAALEGRLDAAALRPLEPEAALARLRELPGVGPFSAELILVRGAGAPDVVARAEPRLRAAIGAAYDLGAPADDAALDRIAEPWRPLRTWVCVLFRATAVR